MDVFGIVSFKHVHIRSILKNGKDPLVKEWFAFKDELLQASLKSFTSTSNY